jgi:putative acetyltransferase
MRISLVCLFFIVFNLLRQTSPSSNAVHNSSPYKFVMPLLSKIFGLIHFVRTNSENKDFQCLAAEMEADLKLRDGENHAFYARLNKIDFLENVLIAFENSNAAGCGALRHYVAATIEIKRMFVVPNLRGRGIAQGILKNLEDWALELHCKKCVLETGFNQPEAISFYKKNGYTTIPNFEPYNNSANSICFEKSLI